MSVDAIAIDGPAGSGKSTVAKAIASLLKFTYLDTGAMYRAVALHALRASISKDDTDSAIAIAEQMDFNFVASASGQKVMVDGEDATALLRTTEVSEWASALSAIPQVRRELVRRQQQLISNGKVVLEGRDTTTVVCPDAKLKVFLTASVEERAKRRYLELYGEPIEEQKFAELLQSITIRDERDSTRTASPLMKAADAIEIDTDSLSIDEVIQRILEEWRKRNE